MVQRQGFFLSQLLDVHAEDLWEGLYSLRRGKPDSEEMVIRKWALGGPLWTTLQESSSENSVCGGS